MKDIIQEAGSLFIGGIVFLMLITIFSRVGNTAATQTFNNVVQEKSALATEIMERELTYMGYGVDDSAYVLQADSTGITFRCDIDDNATPDTITYVYGLSSLPASQHPNGGALYRSVNNGTPEPIAAGVTAFKLRFFDVNGNPTTTCNAIRTLNVGMVIENETVLTDDFTPGVYWSRTFTPKNLR
jgi:hypothetical protein